MAVVICCHMRRFSCSMLLILATVPRFLRMNPPKSFSEALLERGYFDIAISYLGSLENSDLISEEYRKVLPLRKGRNTHQECRTRSRHERAGGTVE